jgi:hypothetical protein
MIHDADKAALLAPKARQAAALPAGPPILLVTVDTEAEFDWQGPFLHTLTSVCNVREQTAAQAIYNRFGVRPTYFVDYAVATQPDGYLPLRDIARSGACEIGAHLHPWITPPLTEQLGERTSFSQNLPLALQRDKLARLTDAIAAGFGSPPVSYRAGRLGVGEEIAEILEMLGYEIDSSVLSGIDLRRRHGPDFRRALDRPYWFGRAGRLLEIPVTCGFLGLLSRSAGSRTIGVDLYNRLRYPLLTRLHAPGVFARLRLLEQIPLSPEGVEFADLRRLTRTLLSRGHRVFVLSYHSSSLLPGSTQYVRSQSELSSFLRTIEQYLELFLGEIGGVAMTPSELRASLVRSKDSARAANGLAAAAQ